MTLPDQRSAIKTKSLSPTHETRPDGEAVSIILDVTKISQEFTSPAKYFENLVNRGHLLGMELESQSAVGPRSTFGQSIPKTESAEIVIETVLELVGGSSPLSAFEAFNAPSITRSAPLTWLLFA